MTTRYFATAIGYMVEGTKVRGARTETPEADLAWMHAYVADRRRRGIPSEGVRMEGEDGFIMSRTAAQRELGLLSGVADMPDVTVKLCKRGHPQTVDNVFCYTDHKGYACEGCRLCRNIRAKEQRLAKIKDGTLPPTKKMTKCKRGHEFTEDNTDWFERADGMKIRRCRACRSVGRSTPRKRRNPKCIHGHLVAGENAVVRKDGTVICRECQRKSHSKYYRSTRSKVSA